MIRHGLTLWNEEKRYLGQTDLELSEKGIQQMRSLDLSGIRYEWVVSSPLLRCTQSAEILCNQSPDYLIEKWKEIDFGDFEGKNYQDLAGNRQYQEWIDSNGRKSFPNGEDQKRFVDRCMEGFHDVMHEILKNHIGSTLAVVHGGTIMALMSGLTGKEYFDFQVKAAAGYRLLLDVSKESVQLIEYEAIKC